ncbi:MAG: hypothetical protein HRU15_14845, partial [Planctomycetes bacterium]|nr:hypothetical protein [Planctomycetota bacterium]
NDPKRKRQVPYAFTIAGNDANDYRALLKIPSLENILGPAPVLAEPNKADKEKMVLKTFLDARKAYQGKDLDHFWELLDCISHSQASHYADQIEERLKDLSARAKRLSISKEKAREISDKEIWFLPWSKRMLEPLLTGKNPKFIPAKTSGKGKSLRITGPFVQVDFLGRKVKFEIPPTRRNGDVQYKVFLKSPFYQTLRMHHNFEQNDFNRSHARVSGNIRTSYEEKRLAGTGLYQASDSSWAADLTIGDFLLIFPNGRQDLRDKSNYQLWNGKKQGGQTVFKNPNPSFSIKKVTLKSGVIEVTTASKVIKLNKVAVPVSSTMNSTEGEALFDGSGIDKWLRAVYNKKDKYFLGSKAETRDLYSSFKLHMEFQNAIYLYNSRSKPARSPFTVSYGPISIRMADTFGLDWDEFGGIGSTSPVMIEGKHFKRLKAKQKVDRPVFVCGELFMLGKRTVKSQLPNLCLPPAVWQTLDLEYNAETKTMTAKINGKILYKKVDVSAVMTNRMYPIGISGSFQGVFPKGMVKIRNIRISKK